jgi:NAD(P)-dependent dehydrogenase (short-subunit alcohol dehydrogenase family)
MEETDIFFPGADVRLTKEDAMDTGLRNKVALITGAGREDGIGFGIAACLAAEGVNVILADLPARRVHAGLDTGSMEDTVRLAAKLAGEYRVKTLAVEVDVADMDSCRAMVEKIRENFPVVHILCNNAGVSLGAGQPMHACDEKVWTDALDINLSGMFRVSKAVIPLMTEGGSIVNTASRAGKVPPSFNGAYAVSKAGVIMFTKVQARELAAAGIRVNAICPGQIMTGMERWRFEFEARALGTTPAEREQAQVGTIPLGRIGSAREVGDVAVFLVSDRASYMTGQAVNITGGQLMEF